jgi:hypothetical protein
MGEGNKQKKLKIKLKNMKKQDIKIEVTGWPRFIVYLFLVLFIIQILLLIALNLKS